jgi:hypothetical protein
VLDEFTTVIIYANTQGLSGEPVGFRIEKKEDVVAQEGVVFLSTQRVKLVYVGTPSSIYIDGAFGDWNKSALSHDSVNDVANSNVDIWNFLSSHVNGSSDLFFYINVNGEMLAGKSVPFINSQIYVEQPSEDNTDSDLDTVPDSIDPFPFDFNNDGISDSNENNDIDSDDMPDYPFGNDLWLNTTLPIDFPGSFKGKEVVVYIGLAPQVPEKTGVDSVYVFIDSDNDSKTGYFLENFALGADYMVAVKGKDGKIVEREFNKFSGSKGYKWDWAQLILNIDAEKDFTQMEIGLDKNVMELKDDFSYLIKTTDWSNEREDFSQKIHGRGVRGDYPLTSHTKIVKSKGTRGTGTVTGEENKAPATIGWGDTTETEMLNFSIQGSGDVITIDFINITHGGSGDVGDCTVYIYNETDGDTLGVKDGNDDLVGSVTLTGAVTQIDITNIEVGVNYKSYLLITVIFDTDQTDIGTDHFINITQDIDFQLTSSQDSITGTSFPLTGGPTQIIPEFTQIFIPIAVMVGFALLFRGESNLKKMIKKRN